MKTVKFLSLALCLLVAFTSCKKDEDVRPQGTQDNIVGDWTVSEGHAVVYASGYKVLDTDIQTSGTIDFENNNTGTSDFSMNILGDIERAKGPFTWEIDGFEIIMDKGTADETRWAILTDKDNLQELQYTEVDEEEDMEVEFTLTLQRR